MVSPRVCVPFSAAPADRLARCRAGWLSGDKNQNKLQKVCQGARRRSHTAGTQQAALRAARIVSAEQARRGGWWRRSHESCPLLTTPRRVPPSPRHFASLRFYLSAASSPPTAGYDKKKLKSLVRAIAEATEVLVRVLFWPPFSLGAPSAISLKRRTQQPRASARRVPRPAAARGGRPRAPAAPDPHASRHSTLIPTPSFHPLSPHRLPLSPLSSFPTPKQPQANPGNVPHGPDHILAWWSDPARKGCAPEKAAATPKKERKEEAKAAPKPEASVFLGETQKNPAPCCSPRIRSRCALVVPSSALAPLCWRGRGRPCLSSRPTAAQPRPIERKTIHFLTHSAPPSLPPPPIRAGGPEASQARAPTAVHNDPAKPLDVLRAAEAAAPDGHSGVQLPPAAGAGGCGAAGCGCSGGAGGCDVAPGEGRGAFVLVFFAALLLLLLPLSIVQRPSVCPSY